MSEAQLATLGVQCCSTSLIHPTSNMGITEKRGPDDASAGLVLSAGSLAHTP